MIAGPWVSSAIRNQFNTVAGVLVNGTAGGTWEPSGSGSGNGAGSATVQAALAKDAKDTRRTGPSVSRRQLPRTSPPRARPSPAYAKAKAAMDAGTEFSMKLTDGKTLTYRIIGINHDDPAGGSGKAGLTFLTTTTGIWSPMNAIDTNAGGWEKSELRQKMNSGKIWNLMPSDFQSKVKAVKKLSNNVGGGDENKNAAVTATSDKLFLLSYSEIAPPTSYWASYPWTSSEGTQYEAFKGKVTENYNPNSAIAIGSGWWERSVFPNASKGFLHVDSSGNPSDSNSAPGWFCVSPAWCF